MTQNTITVTTREKNQVVDITEQISELAANYTGLVNVFTSHTTCAITTVSLDPGLDIDLLEAVWQMIPKSKYRHGADHAPSHIISSIIGASFTVPVENGKLLCGQWQRIVLVELDGPRDRYVVVSRT